VRGCCHSREGPYAGRVLKAVAEHVCDLGEQVLELLQPFRADSAGEFGVKVVEDARAGVGFVPSAFGEADQGGPPVRGVGPPLDVAVQMEVQEEIACGDAVVHRVMARGTHLGEFPPGIGPGRVLDAMPPTGLITGHAATRNDLLMLSQLGLLPGIKPVSEASWRTQLTPDARPPT